MNVTPWRSHASWTAADERVERAAHRRRPVRREHLVDPAELDERHDALAVLAELGVLPARRGGSTAGPGADRRARRRRGGGAAPASGRDSSRNPRSAAIAQCSRPNPAAATGSTRISVASAAFSSVRHVVTVGPATTSSSKALPARKRCTGPDARPDDARSGTVPTDVRRRLKRAMPICRSHAAAAPRVSWPDPVEQDEQRVAAELQDVAAVARGERDELAEDDVEVVGELLRAGLAAAREPFGERREAGDVDEQQRALDHLVARAVGAREPAPMVRAEVGPQRRPLRAALHVPIILDSLGGWR